MDIGGQVLGVTGRTVNVRAGRNPGPKTVYDIQFSDGNTWTSWDTDKATKAMQLQGQAVDLRGEVTQNGEYTNYKLLDIAPSGQLPAELAPQVSPPNGSASVIPMQAPSGGGGMSPERESKIVKQSCMATAFGFVGSLFEGGSAESVEQATEIALGLAKKLYVEVYGQANVAQPAQTPEAVAAYVNANVGSEAVALGANVPEW